MEGFKNLNLDFFNNSLNEVATFIKGYKKYSPEIRFLMLIDKLKIMLLVSKLAASGSLTAAMEGMNKDERLTPEQKSKESERFITKANNMEVMFELIKKEFEDLEEFIQSDTKTIFEYFPKYTHNQGSNQSYSYVSFLHASLFKVTGEKYKPKSS